MDKKIFEDMRSQLSPDERLVQQVLQKAREPEPRKEITMTDNKIKTNKTAFVGGGFTRYVAAAAMAVVAIGASVMVIRNAGKLPEDDSAPNIVPGASSSRGDDTLPGVNDIMEGSDDKRNYSDVDITFSISKGTVIVNKEDKSVDLLLTASPAKGQKPDKIAVVESYGSNSTVALLYDSGDYEKDGDEIKGDGVYSARYTQQFDFSVQDNNNTNKNEKFFVYHAVYLDDDKRDHHSYDTGLTVFIHNSDKEKAAFLALTAKISEIKKSDAYNNAEPEEKKQMLLSMLYELAEKGTEEYPFSFMDKEDIFAADNNEYISIRAFNRIPLIIQIKPVSGNGLRY